MRSSSGVFGSSACFGHARDAADLGVRAGGRDDRACAAGGDVGTREDHVAAVGQAGRLRQGRARSWTPAPTRRSAPPRRPASWASSISRASAPTASPAASSSRSPGTSSRAAIACSLAVAQHPRLLRREPAQRSHRALGTPFLVGADQGVHQHDGEDHHRVAPVADACRQRRCDEQDVDQRALELAQEHQERRSASAARATRSGRARQCAAPRPTKTGRPARRLPGVRRQRLRRGRAREGPCSLRQRERWRAS